MTNDNFTPLKTAHISNGLLLLEGITELVRPQLVSLVEASLSVSHLPTQVELLSVSEENRGAKSSWRVVLEVSAGIGLNRRDERLIVTLNVERN